LGAQIQRNSRGIVALGARAPRNLESWPWERGRRIIYEGSWLWECGRRVIYEGSLPWECKSNTM